MTRRRNAELDVIAIADHERIDAALAAQQLARRRGMAVDVIVGEEVTTRGGHLVGLFMTQRIRPWGSLRASVAKIHEQGGLAIIAHPLVPYPLCASARSIRRLLERPRSHLPPRRNRGLQPDDGEHALGSAGTGFRAGTGRHRGGRERRPSRGRCRPGSDHISGALRRRPAPGHRVRRNRLGGFAAHVAQATGHIRGTAAQERARGARYRRGTACSARARVATWAITRSSSEDRPGHAVHLPTAGRGQRARRVPVRDLIARGHDVRIISSIHGPQRQSEGDIIRLGYGFSVPANGSVGTLTFSPRYAKTGARDARSRALRRAPLPRAVRALPVASRAARIAEHQHRHLPCLCRLEPGVRVRQADAGAASRGGSTAVSPSARPRATSSIATSRATTRSSPMASTSTPCQHAQPIARYRDGTLNILFVGRFESRKGVDVPAQGLPRAAQARLQLPAAAGRRRPAGARDAALHRHPPAAAASSSWAGSATRTRRATLPRPTCSSHPRPARNRLASCCSRQWPPALPIVCSDIHGYKGVVPRGEQALLVPPRDVKALTEALGARAGAMPSCARGWALRPRAGAPVQLGEHRRQGRGLLPLRDPARRDARPRCLRTSARHWPSPTRQLRRQLSGSPLRNPVILIATPVDYPRVARRRRPRCTAH